MRLSNFTDYSLRVLIYLALKRDQRSTVEEIAKKYQISKNHLVKVVHNLAIIKLINSYKGKGGGISLALPPEKINIGKLIYKLEENSYMVECLSSSGNCKIDSSCKFKLALRLAEQQFYKSLEVHTLMDFVCNKNRLITELTTG